MYSFGITYCQGIVVFACAVKHKAASQLWEVIPAPRIITSPSGRDSTKLHRADHDLTLCIDSIIIKPQHHLQLQIYLFLLPGSPSSPLLATGGFKDAKLPKELVIFRPCHNAERCQTPAAPSSACICRKRSLWLSFPSLSRSTILRHG